MAGCSVRFLRQAILRDCVPSLPTALRQSRSLHFGQEARVVSSLHFSLTCASVRSLALSEHRGMVGCALGPQGAPAASDTPLWVALLGGSGILRNCAGTLDPERVGDTSSPLFSSLLPGLYTGTQCPFTPPKQGLGQALTSHKLIAQLSSRSWPLCGTVFPCSSLP